MQVDNILEIKNLNKTFEKMVALSSLSLAVKKGEKVAILGSSGSGKTTLLNVVSKTYKSDIGEILIDGKNIDEIDNIKKYAALVGIISQSFDLVPQISVLNNVLVGRFKEWGNLTAIKSLFIPKDKNLAIDALKQVGMDDKIYEEVRYLSGGQKQRVAIARVIVQNPEIILADEPVASLDPTRAEDIIKLLCNISDKNNKTLITSIHSVELALKYFDRIIAIKNGKLIYDVNASEMTEAMFEILYEIEVSECET